MGKDLRIRNYMRLAHTLWILASLSGAAANGAPAISNVRYDELSHGSVRLIWSVDTPAYVQVNTG